MALDCWMEDKDDENSPNVLISKVTIVMRIHCALIPLKSSQEVDPFVDGGAALSCLSRYVSTVILIDKTLIPAWCRHFCAITPPTTTLWQTYTYTHARVHTDRHTCTHTLLLTTSPSNFGRCFFLLHIWARSHCNAYRGSESCQVNIHGWL
jgi:hypothetical protein